jgi:hypothetical protein
MFSIIFKPSNFFDLSADQALSSLSNTKGEKRKTRNQNLISSTKDTSNSKQKVHRQSAIAKCAVKGEY